MISREVQLVAVPDGSVRAESFGVFETEVDAPGDQQVLVELRRLGLNAGLAHRLGGEGTAYGPGIGVGDVPSSDAVVEVLESAAEGFAPGDLAVAKVPWCTAAVVDADQLRRIDRATPEQDLEAYLTVLGHVGFTAYTGLIHIGEVRPEDIVCVSGAAGGVGSCVVQFAKARGASVIGVAGSAEKVALLTDVLGADRAINRHDGPAAELLRDASPDGIDLYYDNVGGEQLDAALEVLNARGRIVICGAVAAGSGGPSNYRRMIYQELSMRGFTVTAHEDLRAQFESEVGGWLREGAVRSLHTVFDGIDRVPEAFASLLAGGSSGRVIVAVDGPR
ncbi:NADP-dependent oxidoreductase [Brachybacterium vulturis]|uniref:NADP-dependent oxidoreductase n=1 Tax=Brachybacterium vulturis TaxID=2017484 RepID=A0A291GNZ1_9MICO|nr:NADP-dependent oxidoreductase [Brachybacterium vulturis]ATG51800.1 NADP-dependent oxidoreductase [Brachybacterium vulturis]